MQFVRVFCNRTVPFFRRHNGVNASENVCIGNQPSAFFTNNLNLILSVNLNSFWARVG